VKHLRARSWADVLPAAIFGSLDGVNGVAGLVLGLFAGHAHVSLIVAAVAASGAANAMSMAHGEFVSDDSGRLVDQLARTAAMAVAFSVAALAPPVGFLVSRTAGLVTMAVLTPAILGAIAHSRSRRHGWRNAALVVGSGYALCALAGLAAALVTPGAA